MRVYGGLVPAMDVAVNVNTPTEGELSNVSIIC